VKVRWLSQLGIALACCLLNPAQAQVRKDPCERPVATPATGTTKLTLKGGQSVYHEGEIIPLQLSFTYRLVQYRPQAGPNLKHFFFCLTPDGRDPLQDDKDSGLWGGGGAAPGGVAYDVFNPGVTYVEDTALNESKSVPPGNYRLRLGGSNEIEFQVVPATPEWQAEQLTRAVAVLDADHTKDTPSEIDRRNAVRVLRFLGSEASTRQLARRFWFYDRESPVHPISAAYPMNPNFYGYERSQEYWDIKAGLIASPYRAAAIEELTTAIHDPQHPPTRAMVETLALLQIQSNAEYPRFFGTHQYYQFELKSPTTACPFYFMPCAQQPTKLENQRRAKGAAYNALLAKLLKRLHPEPSEPTVSHPLANSP